MRNSALIGWRSHSGGWLSAISSAVMPRDHKSERLSYVASGFSSQAITSGAIQYGVPMNVFLLPMVRSNCADTPKSTVTQIFENKAWGTLKCLSNQSKHLHTMLQKWRPENHLNAPWFIRNIDPQSHNSIRRDQKYSSCLPRQTKKSS